MAVSPYAASRSRGNHAELFLFIYGDNPEDYFAYTNSERAVTFDGKTFDPAVIDYDGFKMKGRDSGVALKVTADARLAICQLFQGVVPRRKIYLKVYTGDIANTDDPEVWGDDTNVFRLIWTGSVTDANTKGAQKIMSCNTLGAGMKRPGLNRNYQRECGHTLYGEYCLASKAAGTRSTTVDAFTSWTVTFPSGWNSGTDTAYFVGGTLEWEGDYGTEYRRIVDVAGDTVTVDSPVTGLAVSDSIDAILGCPRTFAACTDLHNNPENYGGQFAIPKKNPVNKNNHT